jgi:hypothetical protein
LSDPPTARVPRPLPAWLPHLLAALAYLALAVLVTWPTVLHFDSRITGNLIPDRDQNLWNLWWAKTALLDLHTNPFHTDLLYYPFGVDLYLHDLALPNALLSLLPHLLWGVLAAYNTVVVASYTLTGYAAYRVVLYTLARRDPAGPPPPHGAARHLAAFLGGVVFAFTAYSLDALKQINVLALEWLPFAVEAGMRAWDGGSRRAAALAAVFLVLAMLVNSYYEVLIVLFLAAYVAYDLLAPPSTPNRPPWRARLRAGARRLARLALPFGVPALALGGPYAYGAWRSTQTQRITAEATGQQDIHAADLLSFILPAPDHPWLGAAAPWWRALDPAVVPGYLGLGLVALALAAAGLVIIRRRREAPFWALLAAGAALLAMGSTLQVAGRRVFAGVTIPLPFALLGRLPIFNLLGKVERFEVLTLLALAVLAGWACAVGFARLAARAPRLRAVALPAVAALLLAALLLELPIYPRSDRRVPLPPGLGLLAADPVPGSVLELPFVQVRVAPLAKRMLYQTAHGRPIFAGYISRTVENRNALPCSPLYRFVKPLTLGATDIVTPATNAQPLAVLHSENVRYLINYYRYDVETGPFVEPAEGHALQALVNEVAAGAPIYTDTLMAIYRLAPGPPLTAPSLQVGESWHDLEPQNGRLFRWIDGAESTLCVESPGPARLALRLEATSFAAPRTLEIWQGDRRVYRAAVPTGDIVTLRTPPLDLPAGTTILRFSVPEGAAQPGGGDTRALSLGFFDIRVAP